MARAAEVRGGHRTGSSRHPSHQPGRGSRPASWAGFLISNPRLRDFSFFLPSFLPFFPPRLPAARWRVPRVLVSYSCGPSPFVSSSTDSPEASMNPKNLCRASLECLGAGFAGGARGCCDGSIMWRSGVGGLTCSAAPRPCNAACPRFTPPKQPLYLTPPRACCWAVQGRAAL